MLQVAQDEDYSFIDKEILEEIEKLDVKKEKKEKKPKPMVYLHADNLINMVPFDKSKPTLLPLVSHLHSFSFMHSLLQVFLETPHLFSFFRNTPFN